MSTTPINYHELAKKHNSIGSIAPHESPSAIIPPELQRVENAVGVQYKLGKPVEGSDSIASVAENEPHIIQVNNKARWNQSPAQVKAHEITHLWQAQLPGGIQSKILPDNPKNPYSLDRIDELRKQGHTLATLPREVGATIVQMYVADPSQRKRLQPWIDDMANTPLSIMQPTSPSDKKINRTVRPPLPPIEAYLTPAQMRAKAAKLKPGGQK
jgi:hypothetical protein